MNPRQKFEYVKRSYLLGVASEKMLRRAGTEFAKVMRSKGLSWANSHDLVKEVIAAGRGSALRDVKDPAALVRSVLGGFDGSGDSGKDT